MKEALFIKRLLGIRTFRVLRRNLPTIIYFLVVGLFFFGPPHVNRDYFPRVLESLFDVGIFGDENGITLFTVELAAAFLLVLFICLLRLARMGHGHTAYICRILLPAIAVGFCIKDILLFFLGMIRDYFSIGVPNGYDATSLWPHLPLSLKIVGAIAWLAATIAMAARFRRQSPRRSLYNAGVTILLCSGIEACIASGLFGPTNFKIPDEMPYGALSAVYILPAYMLLGAGLIVFSRLFWVAQERRTPPGPESVVDSLNSLVLFAFALSAFGLFQALHSGARQERLLALRQAFALDTIADRLIRNPEFVKWNSNERSPADYDTWIQNHIVNMEFIATGMKATVSIMPKSTRYYPEYNVTSYESDPDVYRKWSVNVRLMGKDIGRYGPGAHLEVYFDGKSGKPMNESQFEQLFHQEERSITEEVTKIPGTDLELDIERVSWCIGVISVILLCLISDRMNLCEGIPSEARRSYLLWGNTLIINVLAKLWPICLSAVILVQVASIARVALLQEMSTGSSGQSIRVASFILLLLMASFTAPASLAIVRKCHRIRRSIMRLSRQQASLPMLPPRIVQ